MHHKGVLRHLEVQIYFHPSVMGMTGHGIPNTAGFQFCHAHLQLTTLHLAGQNIFADHPVVGVLQTAQFHLILFFHNDHALLRSALGPDQHRGAGTVGRSGIQVEFGRLFPVLTGKYDIPGPHADVHGFLETNLIHPAVHGNRPGPADIDNPQFSSLAKIFRPEFLPCGQGKGLHRHRRSGDNPVNMAVHQLNLSGHEKILDQKLLSQTIRCIMFYIFWGYCCSQFHATPHFLRLPGRIAAHCPHPGGTALHRNSANPPRLHNCFRPGFYLVRQDADHN